MNHDEAIDAPEEDDFVDLDTEPENEAPEAVQAMIGGPNWIYPDLVRIQSSSNAPDASSGGDVVPSQHRNLPPPQTQPCESSSEHQQTSSSSSTSSSRSNCPTAGGPTSQRVQPRLLDPPDVSLLSSISTSSQPSTSGNQNNSIDLCHTGRSSSKSHNANGFKNFVNLNHYGSGSTPDSSPSSSNSSSNSTTNIFIQSSQPSLPFTSQPVLSRNNDTNGNNEVDDSSYTVCRNNIVSSSSTSFGQPTSSLQVANQRLSTLERDIRTLEVQKTLLQKQLLQRDNQISELQRSLSSLNISNNSYLSSDTAFDDTIIRRLNDSVDRLTVHMDNSLGEIKNRIEQLETRFDSEVNDNANVQATAIDENHIAGEADNLSAHTFAQLTQTLVDVQRKFSENHRREMYSFLRNVLTNAIRELDKLTSTSVDTNKSFKINGG